jgi:hypothetical protein
MDASQTKIVMNPGVTRTTRRGQSRRSKNWIIALSLCVVGGVAALAGFSPELFSDRSSAAVAAAVQEPSPTGTIGESDIGVCRRLTFDDKGQVVQDVVPCDGSIRDSRGQLVPIGTIHRLDAISKSFAGH